jgi:hypothetical protein
MEWQVIGKPCPYALVVITCERQPEYDKYSYKAYSVLRFKQAYEVGWPNITDRNQWPEDQKGFKVYTREANKRGVGRNRKNRIPSYLETIGKATRHINVMVVVKKDIGKEIGGVG